MSRRITFAFAAALAATLFAARAGHAQDAAALYLKHCKNCHGPAGGEPSAAMKARMDPPKLFDAAFLAKTSDEKFMESMMKGGKKMKPLAEKMTKQQMEAVTKYVRDYMKSGGK